MKQYFEGSNKKKTWLIVAVIVVILALFFGTRSHKSGDSSGSNIGAGITTPKKISFVQQAKGSGTRVWFYTRQENNVIAKDSQVYDIYIQKDGKTQEYQMFDSDITLGKLSKMNDSQIIELANKQNKKYSTTGLIEQIKDYISNSDRVGLVSELDKGDKLTLDGVINSYTYNKSDDEGGNGTALDVISENNFYSNSKKGSEGYFKSQITTTELVPGKLKIDDDTYTNSIINHIKKEDYKKPKSQIVKVKNVTDNSGNKTIRQNVSYDSYNTFDGDIADDNVYHLALKNKSKFLKLVNLSGTDSYDLDPKEVDVPNDAISRQDEGLNLYNELIGDKTDEITKGVYGYHLYSTGLTLDTPFMSQKVYKSRYIGYTCKTGYLVTRAQNDKQKVTFGK